MPEVSAAPVEAGEVQDLAAAELAAVRAILAVVELALAQDEVPADLVARGPEDLAARVGSAVQLGEAIDFRRPVAVSSTAFWGCRLTEA